MSQTITYNPNANNNGVKFGSFGDIPTRPCVVCEGEYFRAVGDWNMGYRCTTCGTIWRKEHISDKKDSQR